MKGTHSINFPVVYSEQGIQEATLRVTKHAGKA